MLLPKEVERQTSALKVHYTTQLYDLHFLFLCFCCYIHALYTYTVRALLCFNLFFIIIEGRLFAHFSTVAFSSLIVKYMTNQTMGVAAKCFCSEWCVPMI